MSRRLRHYVTVRDERHRVHMFGPSDDVPEWAVAAITLRAAWADADDEPAETPVEPVEPTPPQGTTTDDDEAPATGETGAADDAETVEPVEPVEPVEQGAAPRRRGRPRKSS